MTLHRRVLFKRLKLAMTYDLRLRVDVTRTLRFFLYFFGLGYMFCGVGVVSDIFMNAIEEITSKTVKKVNPSNGEFAGA